MKITLKLPRLASLRETALTVGGLGLLSSAAWTAFTMPAGLAAAGASLLILEWLTRPEPGPRR